MKTRRSLFGCILLILAALTIYRVGFYQPHAYLPTAQAQTRAQESRSTEKTEAPPEEKTEQKSEPEGDADKSADKPKPEDKADSKEKQEPKEPEDPNIVALNLKDVDMKNIIEKISSWTGMDIIPQGEVMKQKITIYSTKKMHKDMALSRIYSALRTKGYVAEVADGVIYLKPIEEAKMGRVPTIPDNQPLALLANKEQIVQRFWKLENYSPTQMNSVIEPLVGEYGYVGADETTGTVMVIDTVANLMRIERIIQEFDVPQAQQTVSDVIEIRNGDPLEIVQMLRLLLGEDPRGRSRGRPSNIRSSRPDSRRPSPSKGGQTSSVIVGPSQLPITLIPEPKRKWIIARASAQDMDFIKGWIERLDMEETVESEYETITITYANPREVATHIENALSDMPGQELRPNVLVRALEQSRQIMIFGRADLRNMIKELIDEIDVPTGEFEQKTFDLKHADAETIKTNIDNLYGDQTDENQRYNYYYWRYGRQQKNPNDVVKVIAFPTMQQVTVTASPENMRKIEKDIDEWDQPLDVDQVKPRIIELKNSDPVQMAQLLSKLFTEEGDNASDSFMRWFWYNDFGDSKKKIIGPLYGQLTFEEVPGTRKIIVISKIPEAYDVVEALVRELDMQEMAEVPTVVTLKYADPEVLAERLNALFNEPGTVATIRMSERGLSEYSVQDNTQNNQNQNSDNQQNSDEYKPWWTSGSRRTDEEPISNVIGRVRFIPDRHSKSIMVLAPPEYLEAIQTTIRSLDVPGKQVMVKVAVLMVDHSSMTSLGVQLSSNPAAFGTIGENALTSLNQLAAISTHGSAAGGPAVGLTGTGTIAGASLDVYALVDFLEKNLDARILNEQTLWTKDNEESDFFKGDIVSIQSSSSVGGTGIATQNLVATPVGMTLRVRPSITPENNVDMIVNVELSQLTDERVNDQPVTSMMKSTTQMIVQDGDTLMLGGILFQRDSLTQRKVPGFGDIPLLGLLFRHKQLVKANSELIVFITPYVSDDGEALLGSAREQIERPKQKLEEVRAQLAASLASLKDQD